MNSEKEEMLLIEPKFYEHNRYNAEFSLSSSTLDLDEDIRIDRIFVYGVNRETTIILMRIVDHDCYMAPARIWSAIDWKISISPYENFSLHIKDASLWEEKDKEKIKATLAQIYFEVKYMTTKESVRTFHYQESPKYAPR